MFSKYKKKNDEFRLKSPQSFDHQYNFYGSSVFTIKLHQQTVWSYFAFAIETILILLHTCFRSMSIKIECYSDFYGQIWAVIKKFFGGHISFHTNYRPLFESIAFWFDYCSIGVFRIPVESYVLTVEKPIIYWCNRKRLINWSSARMNTNELHALFARRFLYK